MTTDNVVPIRPTQTSDESTDYAPILASGSAPRSCTRCASEFSVRTWHVVWPADTERAVCTACALADPNLRPWALRSIAADAIDRALAETTTTADRRRAALALVSDVSWFANWRVTEEHIDVDERPEPDEADEGDEPTWTAASAKPESLRRAAFRAAKVIDRHLVKDDHLLDAVEHAFGNGDDQALAAAVMAIVSTAEAVA